MDAISNIGTMFSNAGSSIGNPDMPIWQKLLGLGAGGAGTIGNILASNKRNQALQQQLDVQKQLMSLTPEAIAKGAAAIEKPLSSGLTTSVGNAVQGYLAERGLSQAPGIQAETLSQGLAPYKLQEQQLAMNAFLQKLGLPAQAAARFLPYPQATDLSKLFQSLFQRPDPSINPTFGTGGIGIANQPTIQQLTGLMGSDPNAGVVSPAPNGIDPSLGTGGGSNSFNWMDLLTPQGLVPAT